MGHQKNNGDAKISNENIKTFTKRPTPRRPVVSPDGGYGWVVMLASFLVNFIVDGVCFTFGIFYLEFVDYFRESKSKTAWVGSVLIGVTLCMGPAVGVLTDKYGCRVVTMAGSILAATAFVLATYSPNIDILILTYGGLGGAGFGLMYLPSIIIVGFYFDKNRAFATGVAVCGSGLGAFAFAPLFEFLIRLYSWKGALWILSAILLNGVVAGALFRPLNISKSTHEEDLRMKTNGDLKTRHKAVSSESKAFMEHPPESTHSHSRAAFFVLSVVGVVKEMMNISLLKDPVFVLYGVSCLLCMFGFLVPYNYLPGYAVGLGIPPARAALIMSVVGILNTLTRVVCGWVSDRPWADCLVINNGALVMGGVATVLCPWFRDFGLLCLFACALGASIAVFTSLRSIIMVDLFGLETLAKSFGLVALCQGVGSFIGPPIAGAIFDMTGSYNFSFYMAGGTLIMAGLVCFPLRRLEARQHGRSKVLMAGSSGTEHVTIVSNEANI